MARTLLVNHPDGDHYLVIPDEARVTFGYFNPVNSEAQERWRNGGPGLMTARVTALRVYEDSTDKRQICCVMGATGFRDITNVKQKKVRERRPPELPPTQEEDLNANAAFTTINVAPGGASF